VNLYKHNTVQDTTVY